MFLNTETLSSPAFVFTMSGLPSPSISATVTDFGDVPVERFTLEAKVIVLEVVVFLNKQILPELAAAISGLPSLLKSPMSIELFRIVL